MLATLDLPPELTPVKEALEASLERVAARFDQQLQSELEAVSDLIRHLGGYRGKMLRPSLVLLFAMASGDQDSSLQERITDEHVVSAAVVEMVHMATLVHDDVLDEAELRRKRPTISHLRGNEAAVILGDYLIASAYELCSQLGDQASSLAVARASMTVCAGELLQLSHRGDYTLDEQTYFQIIDRKTGELVALACELGVRHAGADENAIKNARQFGHLLGQAFQIQDDLLDLTGDEAVVGKSVRRDLDMGKLTLPMIRFLGGAEAIHRERFGELMSAAADGHSQSEDELRVLITRSGAIEGARRDAEELVNQARHCLDAFPISDVRSTLDVITLGVLSRSF